MSSGGYRKPVGGGSGGGSSSAQGSSRDKAGGHSASAHGSNPHGKLKPGNEKEKESKEKEKKDSVSALKPKDGGGKPEDKLSEGRLKPPPAKQAGGGGRSAPLLTGLTEDELTKVANLKFEASEEKLKELAKQTMLIFRDYPNLSGQAMAQRVAEAKRAIAKYEQQVQVWKLQHEMRKTDLEFYEEEKARAESLKAQSLDVLDTLKRELAQARGKRKDLEDLETLAAEINTKRTRAQTTASIAETQNDVERLRAEEDRLDELNSLRQKQAMLLLQAARELQNGLTQHLGPASESGAGGHSSAGERLLTAHPMPVSQEAMEPVS